MIAMLDGADRVLVSAMDRADDGLSISSRKGAIRMNRGRLDFAYSDSVSRAYSCCWAWALSASGSGGYKWRTARNGLPRLRGSSQATVRIPSVRGEIKDRNGLTLVQNRASYEVDFYLPEMVKGYRERFGSPPLTEYRAIISGMPKDQKEPDIIKIVNDGVVPRLNDLDLARDYNAGQAAAALS